jgi:hypothetical protein
MTKCNCCNGESVFTCESCGNGLASERQPFTDSSGVEFDPNTEHAIYVCVDCKKSLTKSNQAE